MSTPPGIFDSLDALDAASASDAAPLPPTAAPFESGTLPPAVTWNMTGAPSIAMSGTYVTADDSVELFVRNSNTNLTAVTAQLRILRPNGTIMVQQMVMNNPSTARGGNVLIQPLFEGFLLAAIVGPPAVQNSRGQTYVQLFIIRGAVAGTLFSEMLCEDYLTSGLQPSWPGSRFSAATEGAGFITTYRSAVPVAGQDPTMTQPAFTRWRLLSVWGHLTTSAVVGNRAPTLIISAGGVTLLSLPAVAVIPANTGNDFSWAAGLPLMPALFNQQATALPTDFQVSENGTIATTTNGVQAGDQWTALAVQVEEWIDV